MQSLLTIKEASHWASMYLNKSVTTANISYLIQYGKVKKYIYNQMLHHEKISFED